MKYGLLTIYSLLVATIFGCQSDKTWDKADSDLPNILFIFADDLTYETISGPESQAVRTPNLEKLMAMGTTFTHAYNMGGWHGAICVASRSMLISGRYLWRAQEMAGLWRDNDAAALNQTWGRLMADGGYDTYMTGKWHVEAPVTYVFDSVIHDRPGMPPDAWVTGGGGERVAEAIRIGGDVAAAMPVGYNRPLGPDDNSWNPTDTSFGGFWKGGKHWSEVLRHDAAGFISQAADDDDPFFMYLAFNAAHDPRQSPQKFLDMYPIGDIQLPENFLPYYPDYDKIGLGPGLRDEALAPFPRTEYAIQKHRQEYYALITHMDEQIGFILEALESSGKLKNTYVVFTADHGLSVGHHGLMGKQNLYDHSIRVPFIVVGPDVPVGEYRHQGIYLQDVMPTVLEWSGIEKPDYVDFHSLVGLIRNPDTLAPYPEIYGAYIDKHRMVVSGDFKLIAYPEIEKLLLFNLNEDPLEMNNLAVQSKYQEKMDEMLGKLKELQKEMGDTLNIGSIIYQ